MGIHAGQVKKKKQKSLLSKGQIGTISTYKNMCLLFQIGLFAQEALFDNEPPPELTQIGQFAHLLHDLQ
jgi:hypothetical protein